MIFTDKLAVKPWHFFMAFDNADLRPGEHLDGILIWEREMWPVKGYHASDYTWRNRAKYKLYRLGSWFAWREADLLDELYVFFDKNSSSIGWKDLVKKLWDH